MTTDPIIISRDRAEPSAITVPLGARATIDTTAGALTVEPGVS